ncbi:MAG: TRAP transporter large permease [Pseudomonadota bacterium]
MTGDMWIGLAGLGGLFLLIALHVPIGVALILVGVLGTGTLIGFGPALALLAIEPSASMASEGLAIVALFILMGNLAHVSGLSAELYRVADHFLGHYRGGLVFATVGASAGFGAVCGSSVATTATMAKIALPEMLDRGYTRSLAAGSIASGGTLGMMIPPSLILILYGVLTENSVMALFAAAIVPGILAVIFYVVSVSLSVRLRPELAPAGQRRSWGDRRRALIDSWGIVTLILAVSGGIYGGVFTVPEAAAVGTTAALLLGLLRRRLNGRAFVSCLRDSAASTGMIFVIIIGASVYSYFATLSGLPVAMVEWISGLGLSPLAVICLLLLMYVVLGSVFDSIAAMVLTLPVVYPLIIDMGFDPIWWGVINVVVMELGMITPPFGINVFVLRGMAAQIPLVEIYRGVVPFVLADLLRLAVLVLLPALTLWLPVEMGWIKA